MRMLLILQIIMTTNYKKIEIQCYDYIDKQLYEFKEKFPAGNFKNAFSDTFMQYLRNKTLKSGVTGIERQHMVKRMYYKLDKVEKLSKELKKYSYPYFVDMTHRKSVKTSRPTDGTPDFLDVLVDYWEPGNPEYSVNTDNFNFGIPKNLTVVHKYLIPVTQRGMFNLGPIICNIVNNYTYVYSRTTHKPYTPLLIPTATTTTEKLSAEAEARKRFDENKILEAYGVPMSEFSKSEINNKKKTFIKENNTLYLHDFSCPIYSDPRSGVKRRKRYTSSSNNQTTLRPPSKFRRRKYWGPRIYETLRFMNDSRRVKKILSEYDDFMLNRGSSFNFGHDTMYESQYDSSSY